MTSTPLRIGIGGLAVECSTYSPHRTAYDDFRVTRDAALLARYAWTGRDGPFAGRVEWVPLLHAVALPGGPVDRTTYDALSAELVTRTRAAGPLDGLVLDVHGAMSVLGMTDAEAHLAAAVREATGPRTLISAAMDPHGNVSRAFASHLDLLTAHRLSPHEDEWATRERAARLLAERLLAGAGRPYRAWARIPVLLPGEKTSTRLEPARSLFGSLSRIAAQDGITDAALWTGYPWADEPRCHAVAVVTGDNAPRVRALATDLAHTYWEARDAFTFVGPTGQADACVAEAVASPARPFVISDSGDNPTAGGAGDLPHMLAALLAHPDLATGRRTALHAGLTDPPAVAHCFTAGTGAQVTLRVGGTITRETPPHPLTGEVTALHTTGPTPTRIAAVRTGGVTTLLTDRRHPFHTRADFAPLDPSTYDVLAIKIGYLEPELHTLAADWRLALTPGAVDQHLPRHPHHHLQHPTHPFHPTPPTPPNLRAVLL